MLTTTVAERAAIAGDPDCYGRLEIQDPDLVWVDVSTGLDTPDWFNSAVISDSIDQNTMSFAAELLRDTNSLSLAPLLESSTLNRNAAGDYAPMLDLHRMWRLSAAVLPHGQSPASRTNIVLWNRDLTNAAWTKTNTTATKDQTGIDGNSNSATRLTATGANATTLQSITLASSARFQSAYVRRTVGTGTVQMTMDNGATWTTIVLTSAYLRVTIPTQTLANPIVGFRIVTSGDEIVVDFMQNEAGTAPTYPIATTTVAVTVATEDWKEFGKGYIGSINVNDSANASISVAGRGEEALIIACEILERVVYSVGSADDMETVIQALLDDNLGAAAPTIYVPTATSFIINEYEQDYGNLMGAISALAALAGYVLRYRYDALGNNRLTLYQPNRSAIPGDEDWTIGPDEYLSVPVNQLDEAGIRNHITVRYIDDSSGLGASYTTPDPPTSASITRYGQLDLVIELSADTQIRTASRASDLAYAVLADLEFPMLEQQLETFGFWPVQLGDYGKLLGNGVTY